MAKKSGKKVEGLWIPNEILVLPINDGCKILLAHIYSFGKKGCWQSNETMGKIFMVDERTISRRITTIKEYLYVKSPKGYYRTLWVKFHPEVKEAVALWYQGQNIPKTKLNNWNEPVRQKCPTEVDKSVEVSTTDECFRLRQNCLTTNTYTNKETNRKTATPAPLPAGGQASALLEYRKEKNKSQMNEFFRKFGKGPPSKRRKELTPQELERRKQDQLRALRATESKKR
jgi:hypothetical protein